MIRPVSAFALLALALAAPAMAEDAGLRGPQSPDPPAAQTSSVQQPGRRTLLSALPDAAPRFTAYPAPRVSGYAPSDGVECRRSCANDSYICRIDQDVSDCNRLWSQCVAVCPEG